jgi:glycosyltransferase involved in cell wall biosynthesis
MMLNRYRSPGKLFEYMASGVPIVSVDLPVLREVLGDDPAAVLVPPDSPDALAEGIAGILDDPARAKQLATRALQRVEAFTWRARADAVRAFVEGAS